MIAIVSGYRYEVKNFDNLNEPNQILQFVHKEQKWPQQKGVIEDGAPLDGDPEITIHDGTTNEEVISVLIHRLKFLNLKQPCKENACAITHLQDALMWLNERSSKTVEKMTSGIVTPTVTQPAFF